MNCSHRISVVIRTSAVAAAIAGMGFLSSAVHAAAITFSSATTIAGDSDVLTTGTAVFTDNLTNTASGSFLVNTVTFANTKQAADNSKIILSSDGASFITTNGGSGFSSNVSTFGSTSTPFSGLSMDYQSVLKSADYDGKNGTSTWTVTLGGLTLNQKYAFQLWVNDSRTNGFGRSGTVSDGTNSVVLKYSNAASAVVGGVGQYTIGSFTANAATQTFTVASNPSTQINAIQLRAIPEPTSLSVLSAGASALMARRRRTNR